MASVDSISDLPLIALATPREESRHTLDVVDRRRLNNGYRWPLDQLPS